ncbi:MAG: mechanosensitive ion channel protein MscS [Micrococcales bacterium]|nr:MAG: mechanosensitive ion channel protein MscS [Micrococcales bacterium]PIE27782.1 MAG: mechanosensitive ion channel protein MscS [Micrococcales bacterium]
MSTLFARTPTPDPSATVTVEPPLEQAQSACESGATVCTWVADTTGSSTFGLWAETLYRTPLRILIVLLAGWALRSLIHRAIGKVEAAVVEGDQTMTGLSRRMARAAGMLDASPLAQERRVQRARTIGSVLRSLTTFLIWSVAALMVLAELGINIAPLLASAGIAGVALGFGAQSLVKDFLSGLFMILEDQYGVGDVVDLGDATGTVEAVGLRATRLRAVDGTVWYVPNGQVTRVGNQSQGWARAVLDVSVPYGESLAKATAVLTEVGERIYADPDWSQVIMEEPQVWGVEAMSAEAVVLRLVVKTKPLEQWRTARELRLRIRNAFAEAGIENPYPHQNIIVKDAGAGKALPDQADAGRDADVKTPPHGEAKVSREYAGDEEKPH